jgi:hypothetical protein
LTISAYAGEVAKPDDIAVAVAKLGRAFPSTGKDFWNILAERIEANDFTAERLRDAVEHVVDTFPYKEPRISDVISFDRRVKLYTAVEFQNAQAAGIDPSEFEYINLDGKGYRVLKSDLHKAGLKLNRQ